MPDTLIGMIWDDPWLLCALGPGGTRLPPLPVVLGVGQRLEVVNPDTLVPYLDMWISLVGTKWLPHEVLARLAGAWIACLFQDSELVATCVLRPQSNLWILETLHARKGFGTPLLRSIVYWLYMRVGPFSLGYIWELSIGGYMTAWYRGWLRSANAIHYGWSFPVHGCGFCPVSWHPRPRYILPTFFQTASGCAIVSDSGLRNGWGNVLAYRGDPDWHTIGVKVRWRSLWMHAISGPKGWKWTGEVVIIGVLNALHQSTNLAWITAEI